MKRKTVKLFVDVLLVAIVVWGIISVHPYRNDFWGAAVLVMLIFVGFIEIVGVFIAISRIRREMRYNRIINNFTGTDNKESHTRRLYGNKYR